MIAAMVSALFAELSRQDDKWGEQNHRLIGGRRAFVRREAYRAKAAYYKDLNDDDVARQQLGWDTVLLEEVYEALEAETPEQQIEELIQSAAVCIQTAMSIRRNELAG